MELRTPTEDSSNPYDPPASPMELQPPLEGVIYGPLVLSIQWTVVVLLNLIVPLLFGWSMTSGLGHVGIVSVIIIALVLGYAASFHLPLLVLVTTRGALLVAISQVVPIFHAFIGFSSIAILRHVNVISSDPVRGPRTGFWGGFFLTAMTAAVLISASCLLGFVMRRITPDRWWLARKPSET
jgi:hypothetical protein